MASVLPRHSIALALVVAAVSVTGAAGSSKSLNITNNCAHTVWPAISTAATSAAPDTTGFELAPGQWEIVAVPSGWSGLVWGRTLCSSSSSTTDDDSSGNNFTCVTGDCGTGNKQDCAGGGGPVTLAEFTLDGSGGMDTTDVSLVDGCNLPVMLAPRSGNNCAPTGCMEDMNGVGVCPPELRVTSGSGSGGDTTYAISFCPSTASGKLSSSPNSQAPPPGTGNLPHTIDGTTPMPYTGGGCQVVGTATPPWRIVLVVAVLSLVTAALTLVGQFLVLFRLFWNQAAAAAAAGAAG